jgi:chemotaxis response regulator CheB
MAIKVLIVDDAMFMRNMIAEIFNGKNYSGEEYEVVAEAENGQRTVSKPLKGTRSIHPISSPWISSCPK